MKVIVFYQRGNNKQKTGELCYIVCIASAVISNSLFICGLFINVLTIALINTKGCEDRSINAEGIMSFFMAHCEMYLT